MSRSVSNYDWPSPEWPYVGHCEGDPRCDSTLLYKVQKDLKKVTAQKELGLGAPDLNKLRNYVSAVGQYLDFSARLEPVISECDRFALGLRMTPTNFAPVFACERKVLAAAHRRGYDTRLADAYRSMISSRPAGSAWPLESFPDVPE
jgi:hypothetical protein